MSSSHLRLSAFTLRNVLTAGDTPVRIEFGRRLTLMYGENGVGKSGFRKVMAELFVPNENREDWDDEHWYAVPCLPLSARHQMDTTAASEVTFTYETLDGTDPEFRSITLRWPGYDGSDSNDVGQLLLSGAREVEVERADGSRERVVIYNLWRSTKDGPELLPTRFAARRVPVHEGYSLNADDSRSTSKALIAPFAPEAGHEDIVDVVQQIHRTLSEHAAPPFLVRPDGKPNALDPEDIGYQALERSCYLLELLWAVAAPCAPHINIDPDHDPDEDDMDDLVTWTTHQAGATMYFDDLSSGEQRIYVLLSNVLAWHTCTDPEFPFHAVFSRHTCLLEEPETHLHPRAQGSLLRALLDLQRGKALLDEHPGDDHIEEPFPPAFVLETHSEAFLRAVQSALRTGALQPDDLRVNVFNRDMDTFLPGVSQAMFGADGNLHHMWPGVFPSGDAGEPS